VPTSLVPCNIPNYPLNKCPRWANVSLNEKAFLRSPKLDGWFLKTFSMFCSTVSSHVWSDFSLPSLNICFWKYFQIVKMLNNRARLNISCHLKSKIFIRSSGLKRIKNKFSGIIDSNKAWILNWKSNTG